MTVPRIVVVTVMCRNERMWVRVVLTMIPGVSEMGEEENGDYAWFCAAKCRVCVCVCVVNLSLGLQDPLNPIPKP